MKRLWRLMKARLFREDKKGQGIVEYAFVIAFIGVLIAMAFMLTKGSLFDAISGAYSNCSSSLGALNKAANEAGSGADAL